jgi:hypothetical protein
VARPDIPSYAPARLVCRLENPAIDESSGLAVSGLDEGVYWTHNDSGGAPVIYAFDALGRDLGACRVARAHNVDWEDIAAFALNEKHYIAVADTGDNQALMSLGKKGRAGCVIYFVEEPALNGRALRAGASASLRAIQRFTYEDGPHDCEAVAVDARGGAVYLATKSLALGGGVYELAVPRMDGSTTDRVAHKVASVAIPLVTAMDLSGDGARLVILNYFGAAQFARSPGEPWQQALARTPRWAKLSDPGRYEAVAFGRDGATLYVTSEIVKRSEGGTPLYVLSPQDAPSRASTTSGE